MGITEPRATDLPPPPPPSPRPTYLLSRWLFLRLLGVVYLIAFVSLALQITGLVGEHGILPARTFLERAHALYGGAAYRLFPTLCWLVGGGDGMLRALCWGGAVLALLVVAGVAQAPALALLWLLFRLMFLSGITKLASGDPTWRDLTALDYHFWTQPLPSWTAWYAHWLPEWTHRGMLLLVLVAELGAPWLIFVSQRLARLRLAACGLLVLGQLGIAVTGNYGFFNALALVLCVPLVDDATVGRALPLRLEVGEPEPLWKRRAVRVLVPVVAVLSLLAFVREIVQTLPGARGRAPFENPLLDAVAPFRSINGYGLFRVMTTERPEIVVEGSRDTMAWREYRFRWKPGDVTRRPRFVAPHQPRLDWQMWFAALDPDGARGWLLPFVARLLQGSPEVVSLLAENPFPEGPPRYVRLAYYRYRFSTPAERARTGAWWDRVFAGYLTRPLSLADLVPPR